mgnify:CR=1 FL=1
MSFSVNYLVFCVPTLHINNYRNRDIVLNTLIAEFITLCVKHHMAGKVPKSKDFYKVSLCSNTIVSTWLAPANTVTDIKIVSAALNPADSAITA